MFAEALAATAALICLDPGHGTLAEVARQQEPIGPGSSITKINDGGGAGGETEAVMAIAKRTRTLLVRLGYRVAMTRSGSWSSWSCSRSLSSRSWSCFRIRRSGGAGHRRLLQGKRASRFRRASGRTRRSMQADASCISACCFRSLRAR